MNNQPHTHELQVWRSTETTCVTYGDQARYLHRLYPWVYRWFGLAVPHPLPIDVRIHRAARKLRRRHDRSFGWRRWSGPRLLLVDLSGLSVRR